MILQKRLGQTHLPHTTGTIMNTFTHSKYQANPVPVIKDRTWPDNVITKAPHWCSVDLRDGNQALINPMNAQQKLRLFNKLVELGFKSIEVGFPAASQTDYDFVRYIIEHNKIPEDVSIQVLTQARDHLIEQSFAALKGAKKAIMHVYNSTSTIQRERVFAMDKAAIKAIAVAGAIKVQEEAKKYPETQWQFQYSPESFSQTETDYAVEVCNRVIDIWQGQNQPTIINLPATVEANSPNAFADQVEYFCRHVKNRERIIVSLHTHNDRGCAIAAAELGLLAGADRIEGTLLGNGERTGNMDIVTMAMNFYSQGIDPELNLRDMDSIVETVKACTQLPVHPRHPYAGELVFTAFSGSHQDAIKKSLARQQTNQPWQVAYLPIDPKDIGRSYEAVIRINSQSGKGGVAYILEQALNMSIPRWMQIEFSRVVQRVSEQTEKEVSPEMIQQLFFDTYQNSQQGYTLAGYQIERLQKNSYVKLTLQIDDEQNKSTHQWQGTGDGALSVMSELLHKHTGATLAITEYNESNKTAGNNSVAQCFVQANINGERFGGFGESADVAEASLKALLSAYSHYQQNNNKVQAA